MATVDAFTLALGDRLDAILAAVVLGATRLDDGRIVRGAEHRFDRKGVLTEIFDEIKQGWSPCTDDGDLAELLAAAVHRGGAALSKGERIDQLRALVDHLTYAEDAS